MGCCGPVQESCWLMWKRRASTTSTCISGKVFTNSRCRLPPGLEGVGRVRDVSSGDNGITETFKIGQRVAWVNVRVSRPGILLDSLLGTFKVKNVLLRRGYVQHED